MRSWIPALLLAGTAMAQETREPARGLPPEEAVKAISLPEGFHAELFAAEPDVRQPIGYTVDARGRLWVAENFSYPNWAPEGNDRIIILEDSDGDGRADKRTVFHEGLNFVSGIEVGFGGVWIGSPPHLLFIPDRDGDDVPDGEPEVLLDGWGHDDTHETLNAFTWGPDGWLYGCHGVFTHSKVGKPGATDAEREPLNAGIWRYHPTKHQFEVFAHGTSNPWGVDFDKHGQCFNTACVIPHLFHIVQGGRFHRQAGRHFNPYTFDDIKTIADHRHEGWHRKHPRADGHKPVNDVGGGHAHAGALIYQGGLWPEKYHGSIFMHNVHASRINRDTFARKGSGFVASHAPDFMHANDLWYRGLHLRPAPDGNIYASDWYDELVCHQQRPKDTSNGRIYKICYGERKDRPADLTKLNSIQLVQLQGSENIWESRTARRLLQERQARGEDLAEVSTKLEQLLHSPGPADLRLRSLWSLHGIGRLSSETIARLLKDKEEYLRAWTIQLACENKAPATELLSAFAEMAREDPSPVVRLYLASALQRMPLGPRWEMARGLITHEEDNQDHNIPLVVWYGIEPLCEEDPQRALELAFESRLGRTSEFIARRIASRDELRSRVLEAAAGAPGAPATEHLLRGLSQGIKGRQGLKASTSEKVALASLRTAGEKRLQAPLSEVARLLGTEGSLDESRSAAADANLPADERREALEALATVRDRESLPAFYQALAHPELRATALRGLLRMPSDEGSKQILAHYPEFNPDERQDALTALATRPQDALLVIEGLAKGTIARSEISPFLARQLLAFDKPAITDGLATHWGTVTTTPENERAEIEAWKRKLTPQVLATGDRKKGQQLFTQRCATCHELFGAGQAIGPGLTGSNRGDLGYLLENIIAPNIAIGQDYQLHVVTMKSGQVVSGLLVAATDQVLTIRTLADTQLVARAQVTKHEVLPVSMMPPGLLTGLSDEDVRDLIAYLQGIDSTTRP